MEVNGHSGHWDLKDDISKVDPEMCEIIKKEKDRQKRGNIHTKYKSLNFKIQ